MSDGTEMILSGWAGLKALWLSSLSSTGDRPNLRSRWGSSKQAVCSLVWHDSAKHLSPEEFLIPDEIMLFCFGFGFFFPRLGMARSFALGGKSALGEGPVSWALGHQAKPRSPAHVALNGKCLWSLVNRRLKGDLDWRKDHPCCNASS